MNNLNGEETNPIMSRLKSQKMFEPKATKTPEKVKENDPVEEKPKIYKPPNRSQSLKHGKNLSPNTSSASVTTSGSYNNSNHMNNKYSQNLQTETSNGNFLNNGKVSDLLSEVEFQMINAKTHSSKIANNDKYSDFNTNTFQSNMRKGNIPNSATKSNFNTRSNTMSSINNFHPINVNDSHLSKTIIQHSKNPIISEKGAYSGNNRNSFLQSSITNSKLNYDSPIKPFYRNPTSNNYINKFPSYRNNPNGNYQAQNGSQNFESSKYSSFLINLEDLMLMEEKLVEIVNNINNNKPIINATFEWWNFYFNCSLCGKFENYFKEECSKIIISESTHLELISIIICYDSYHDKGTYNKILPMIKAILSLIHQNFLILCDYILTKICVESLTNIWVYKLNSLVESKMKPFSKNLNNDSIHSTEIKYNNNCIYDYLRIIIKNYPQSNEITNTLVAYFKNINKLNIQILNNFFATKVLRVLNKNASVLAAVLPLGEKIEQIPVPYLKRESLKEFTLVLDLDETLIHFKIDTEDCNKGLLRLRPGLFEFLDCVCNYYELIVFTAGTQDYADPILDTIEQDQIYFDYRLYRQHAVIDNNDFVKDISRLGRDLSKVMIVDNMPQNFRLQKENGIFINSFYGDDPDDSALFDLIPILKKIAEDKKNKDVRVSLLGFKDEILKKISSNIDKQSTFGK